MPLPGIDMEVVVPQPVDMDVATTTNAVEMDDATIQPHTHDDRYYTKGQTDDLLDEKSDVGHTHDDRYYTESETDSKLAEKAPLVHNHDDRYYTESETDSKLAQKAPLVHNHDDRYYTESETDSKLAQKAPLVHNHDDRYYTESETDDLLDEKSDVGHIHDDRYYTESEMNTLLGTKSPLNHNHDNRYSQLSHNHDDRYYTETEIDTAMVMKESVENKTNSLTSASTDSQYPTAKVVYETTEDIREIAAGKSTNYAVSKATNPAFDTQSASITITTFTDILGTVHTFEKLKIGDNIYVVETDVPDRWVSAISPSGAVCHILETAKVPVMDVKKNEVSVVINGIAHIPNNLSDYAQDSTHRLVTDTEKATWNAKQPAGNYMTLDTDQTATSKKTLSYTEPLVRGGQETILNVLSTHTNDEMESMWAGRMKIGNMNKTFMLGVYRQLILGQPAICGIGAHSWENSFNETGAAWEDIYLNPDGNKTVYIGDHDWRAGTGWFKVQNSGTDYNGKTYCNRGNITSPTWREVATVNDGSLYATNETWSASKLNTQFSGKEATANKVTSISSSSTNTQYPSAKCVYDAIFGAMEASY